MNKRHVLAVFAAVASLVTGILAVQIIWAPFAPDETPITTSDSLPPPPDPPRQRELPDFIQKLSGPYTHKNLTFYLVHGADSLKGKTPLTLEEASRFIAEVP